MRRWLWGNPLRDGQVGGIREDFHDDVHAHSDAHAHEAIAAPKRGPDHGRDRTCLLYTSLYAREGRITLRTVLGKFFCTSATLASGIPLGREGPSVQVGAGIASVLGRFLGLRTELVKKLIPVGAAAAIAAAFNTPLAAVLFALEEIVGDLNAPVTVSYTHLV